MLNLALACLPTFFGDRPDAEEGFLGKLVLWARRKIRYQRALNELYRLDDRDLDELASRGSISPSWPGAMPPARRRSPVRIDERHQGAGSGLGFQTSDHGITGACRAGPSHPASLGCRSLREPAVNRGEQVVRLEPLAVLRPQTGERGRGP